MSFDPGCVKTTGMKLVEALKKKEHIIWDWNGTLLDDVHHAVSTINLLLQDHHLPLITREHYRKIFGFPVRNYYEQLGFNFQTHSFEDICEDFVSRYMKGLPKLGLMPQMFSTLVELHQHNRTQSILSATDQENLDLIIQHYDLNSIFTYVFGIDNKMAGSKIERGHELIRISNIPLEKTILVGDTLHDLEVGKELGIEVILISHGHQCPTRLREHHDWVLEV